MTPRDKKTEVIETVKDGGVVISSHKMYIPMRDVSHRHAHTNAYEAFVVIGAETCLNMFLQWSF